MNRLPSQSFKLTNVFFVVVVLGVSAFLSNSTIASPIDLALEQIK